MAVPKVKLKPRSFRAHGEATAAVATSTGN
jgi:hypothetical protein